MTTSPTPAEHTARPKSRSIAAIQKLIDDFFSPWGSWKTAWWEMEVGDSDPFHPNALLREIHKRLDGPDWERLYLRDMEAIADLVGKPDMSRLYDVLQAAVNERPKLLSLLADCYARLHDHYREGGGGYMEPPSPADEWSYGIIPLFVAIQNATGKNHDELLTAGNTALKAE